MIIKPIALKDAQEKYFGSVFLDNLTISCALRALRTTSSPIPVESDDASQRISRRVKWDYDLNDAFRWAIDIFSLAQFIEAIVLFDHILVDVSYVDRWGLMQVLNEGQDIEILDTNAAKIGSLIVPLQPNPLERLRLVCNAIDFIEQTTSNGDLHEFMKLLSETSAESVFIHISNGYFETGYSDKMLFPDAPLRWAYDIIFNDLKTEFTQSWYKNLTEANNPEFLSLFRKFLDFSSLILNRYQVDVGYEKMLLSKTLFPRGDGHEKLAASVDVIQNAIAALFYEDMAMQSGIAYLPHVMRSYFVLYRQIVEHRGLRATTQAVLRCLEEFRHGHAHVKSIHEFYGDNVIDLDIPFLLAMVLKQVSKPEEIIDAALELRNSQPARDFRAWTAMLDQKLNADEVNMATLSTEAKSIKGVFARWSTDTDNREQEPTSWSIALSPGQHHLVFLQRLAQLSNQTLRFEILLSKVFGKKYGAYWQQYRNTIDLFTQPPTEITDKRLRLFSKRTE